MKEQTKEYLIIMILPVMMFIFAFSFLPLKDIYIGLVNITKANDILVSDYFYIGNIPATLINSSITTMLTIFILYKLDLRLNGLLISAILLVTSFSFMGKNIYNILPFYIGTYIHSKVHKKNIKTVIAIGIMSSTLAPIVTSLGLFGFLLGILIAYLMPFIAQNTIHYHNGYSLYNTGLAGGLLGIVIYSLLSSFGIHFDQNKIFYTGMDDKIFLFFLIYFMFLIGIALYEDKYIYMNVKNLHKHTGRLVTDFVKKEGFYATIFNMGMLGLMCLALIYYYKILNGPVICAMLTTVAFGGFGKHIKNTVPLIIGVIIAENVFKVEINTTLFLMSIFFSTTLAPIAGKFGIVAGIIIGIIQYALAIHIGVIHGGINLYNNGLAAGIVASVSVPILEVMMGGIENVRAKKENRKNG